MTRLVVLALSEASPTLVERFAASGGMPNLRALAMTGMSGRTRYSTPYLLTPQMWATILTGRTPGSHGVFDYWQRGAKGAFYEIRGGDIQGPRIWDELEKNGIPCGLVNVPMTFPPPQLQGFALSGQDAPGAHPSISRPRSLYRDLTRRFGRYHHKDIFPGGQAKSEYASLLAKEVKRQAELFEWMVLRRDWRFLMLYSSGTAFAQHYFWDDMDRGEGPAADAVEATYAATDEMIGRIAGVLDPGDELIVMSECGAGPIESGVRINAWLRQHGFLAHRSQTGRPSPHARLLSQMRIAAQRYLPKSLFHLANSLPVKRWMHERVQLDGIDWTRTLAYHRGKGEGNIYLNLEGREPRGIVPLARYDAVRDQIIEGFLALKHPKTGASVVNAVHRREDLFDGDLIAAAPDLIIEWEGFRYMPSEDIAADDMVFAPRTREYMTWPTTGSHRPEGMLLAHGGRFGASTLNHPVDLIDLAPTWLALLGAPVPSTMSGRPATELLQVLE